jgi:hypothetical protein
VVTWISVAEWSSRRRVAIILSQIALALGACGGLARILMPSAANNASNELVNLARAIPEQEFDRSRALAQVYQEVT